MSALLHGKGCFNKLKRTTDDEEVKPLFCATFIVKHPVCPHQQLQTSCIHAPLLASVHTSVTRPSLAFVDTSSTPSCASVRTCADSSPCPRPPQCCCCWSALVLTILLSVLGIFVVASSAPADSTTGPLLQEGLTYPFFHPIARKMDALALARDESEEAVLRWDTMNGGRRMLSAQGKEAKAPKWPLASVMKGLGLPEEAHRRLQAGGGPEEDGLQAGQQYQQEEWLTSALFIYKSRDDSGSVFSDESLDELCQLHNTLTSHAEYPDYCLKVAAWVGPDNVRHTYCATGFSPLSLFYGDADYDVDDLDLSILRASPSAPPRDNPHFHHSDAPRLRPYALAHARSVSSTPRRAAGTTPTSRRSTRRRSTSRTCSLRTRRTARLLCSRRCTSTPSSSSTSPARRTTAR